MHLRKNQITALLMLVLFVSQPVVALGQTFDSSVEEQASAANHEHCADGQSSTDPLVDTDPTAGSCHENCQHCVNGCCLFLGSVQLAVATNGIFSILVNYSIPGLQTRARILYHPPRFA